MGTIRGLDEKIKNSNINLEIFRYILNFDISYTERPISPFEKPKLMPRTSNSLENGPRSLKTDLSCPKTDLDGSYGHWDTWSQFLR